VHVVAPAVSDSPEIVNKRMVILSNTGAAGKIDVGGDSVQLRKGDGVYITLTPGTKVDVENVGERAPALRYRVGSIITIRLYPVPETSEKYVYAII